MQKEELHTRECNIEDLAVLQALSIQTFTETYDAVNTPENMAIYIDHDLGTEQLTKELLDPQSKFYFVEHNHVPIGFLKLNFSSNDQIDPKLKGLEIARIYVLKEYQDKGIGQFLMYEVLNITRTEKFDYIWLGVWENNLKARAFYERNGFTEFGTHVFPLGTDLQNDILVWKRTNLYESQ